MARNVVEGGGRLRRLEERSCSGNCDRNAKGKEKGKEKKIAREGNELKYTAL